MTQPRQPRTVVASAPKLVALDDDALNKVHGGEVGQVAQSLRVYEFGMDPPRVACAWSNHIANELY